LGYMNVWGRHEWHRRFDPATNMMLAHASWTVRCGKALGKRLIQEIPGRAIL
jgi:hypothetical protein